MKHKYYVIVGFVGLVLVYVFQRDLFFDPFENLIIDPQNPQLPDFNKASYIFSKVLRFVLNDFFSLLVIWGLFGNKSYLRFAIFVFLIGFIVLLPMYIIGVLFFFSETFFILNHLHRIVLNPVLMMLLIPAFYYQQQMTKNQHI